MTIIRFNRCLTAALMIGAVTLGIGGCDTKGRVTAQTSANELPSAANLRMPGIRTLPTVDWNSPSELLQIVPTAQGPQITFAARVQNRSYKALSVQSVALEVQLSGKIDGVDRTVKLQRTGFVTSLPTIPTSGATDVIPGGSRTLYPLTVVSSWEAKPGFPAVAELLETQQTLTVQVSATMRFAGVGDFSTASLSSKIFIDSDLIKTVLPPAPSGDLVALP